MLFKRQDWDFNSSLVTGPEIRSKIRRTVPASSGAPVETREYCRWTRWGIMVSTVKNYGFATPMGGSFPEFRGSCTSRLFLPVCSISPSPLLCLFFISSDLFLSLTVATFFFFFFVSHLLREEMIASFHTGEKRNYRRGEKKKKKEKREKLRKKM